jgi:hypothetical protein
MDPLPTPHPPAPIDDSTTPPQAYRMIFFWGKTDLVLKNRGAYRLHVTTGYAGMSEQQKEKARRISGGGDRVGAGPAWCWCVWMAR